jgi:hypothetical protein
MTVDSSLVSGVHKPSVGCAQCQGFEVMRPPPSTAQFPVGLEIGPELKYGRDLEHALGIERTEGNMGSASGGG